MSNATERVNEMEAPATVKPVNAKVTTDRRPGAPEYEISVDPIEFESTVGSKLITTLQLGEIINGLFRPFFKDYVGCNIQFTTLSVPMNNAMGMNGFVDPGLPQQHMVGYVDVPRFEVELYFQSGANNGRASEGAYKNIVERGREYTEGKTASSRSDALAASIARINSRSNPGKNFTLSRETKDMLEKFYLPFYKKNQEVEVERTITDPKTGNDKVVKEKYKVAKPDYEGRLIYEITDSPMSNPNLYGVYVKVTNLDLITILRQIWGETNEDGHPVDYEVRAIRPLSTYGGNMMPNNAFNALLQINRLDCVEVNKLSKSLGMMTMIGNLPINRA